MTYGLKFFDKEKLSTFGDGCGGEFLNYKTKHWEFYHKLFTSKLHQFENLPEPRNATEAFHSNKSYDFYIPNNIDDFNKSSSKKNSTSKINSIFKDDYKFESMRKQIKKLHINDNDELEAHNNPNLHSEEQDELELPEKKKSYHQDVPIHLVLLSKGMGTVRSVAVGSTSVPIKKI
ncbi:hypothetical protein RhiirA1_519009 [Rhizophagus irregularis]|uniref:Uncharacterized protein n=1 Tax=Rhizophagus irregularis TaxID=588596 RepID=A0A2N0RJU9_9GLOM|nr:hypothetical protein RhiirA1_519009 [Rhizophagus irregularis]